MTIALLVAGYKVTVSGHNCKIISLVAGYMFLIDGQNSIIHLW